MRPDQGCQYNAVVTNGTAATYTWYVNGQPVGSDAPTLLYSATSSFALSVWVTSVLSEVASDSLQMVVDAQAEECAEW